MEIEIILTGTKYYRGFPCLDLGGEVRIEFDEQNEYSDNAFGVFTLGGLRIGSVAENPRYIPRIITSEATKLSPELKQLLNDGYTIDKAVCTKIRNNMAVIEVTLNNPSPINEMEEDNMDKPTITVVGVKYHKTNASEGDIVRFKVIKGTTTLFDTNGNSLGVLPQGDKKVDELKAINAPIVKNREVRDSFSFLEQCYTVISVVEDKYIFLREMEEEDLINTQTTKEEPVNEHIGKFTVLEELIAYDLMVKATNKIAQTIIEEMKKEKPINKEMEELEVNNIEKELDELNSSIRALKAQKEAIEAEMTAKMAKREELAKINAKRNVLIEEISKNLKTLDLSVLEEIKEVMSSSTPKEDISSSNGDNMEFEYGIILEEEDEKVKELMDKINTFVAEIKQDKATFVELNDIQDNKVFACVEMGRGDIEHPKDEKHILECVETTLEKLNLKFQRDEMPNVDYNEYCYPITITL